MPKIKEIIKKGLFLTLFFVTWDFNFIYAQVTAEWIQRYDGPDKLNDNAYEIATDKNGNVYVSGMSDWKNTGADYNIIKYNSKGDFQWTARYSGPLEDDLPIALAVDDNGNICVTGRSDAENGATDYVTIKYSSSGNQLWIQRFNGKMNKDDIPGCLAIDNIGNVYVTGSSDGTGSFNADFATIKYNSNGVQQWVTKYNGSGNGTDTPESMAIDDYGNVFVTGSSVSSGTHYNIVTIKYDLNGVQQWVNIYNSPENNADFARSLAIDDSGNIYVTGGTIGNNTKSDFATLKYNFAGEILWIRKYNGPASDVDYARFITLDSKRNIYITGYSTGKGSEFDYATIKYNLDGDELWATRYNGPGNKNDLVNSLVVDDSGNIYITGQSEGIGTGADYATIKYNSDGVQQWAERYNGPADDNDNASSVAVDNSGNIYVTGNSTVNKKYNTDFVTIKYK